MTNAMTANVRVAGFVGGNTWNYYNFAPNSGNNMIIYINTTSTNGDCDLYVKRGQNPTLLSFDYADAGISKYFQPTVPDPAADTWYFGVYGYSACSYQIWVSVSNQCPGTPPCSNHGQCTNNGQCICNVGYSGNDCSISGNMLPVLSNGVSQIGSVNSTNSTRWQYYQFGIVNTTFLTIVVKETVTSGFVWLYASKDSTPDLRDYDYSDQGTNSIFHRIHIVFDSPTTDTYYFGVYSNPFSNIPSIPFTIAAWYSPF